MNAAVRTGEYRPRYTGDRFVVFLGDWGPMAEDRPCSICGEPFIAGGPQVHGRLLYPDNTLGVICDTCMALPTQAWRIILRQRAETLYYRPYRGPDDRERRELLQMADGLWLRPSRAAWFRAKRGEVRFLYGRMTPEEEEQFWGWVDGQRRAVLGEAGHAGADASAADGVPF